MESITYLTYLGLVVIAGLLCSVLAAKFKMPNILLLLFTGMLFGRFWNVLNFLGTLLQRYGVLVSYTPYPVYPLISFPPLFIATLGLLALVMLVFESTSRFKYKDLDDFSLKALKLSVVFLAVNMVVLTVLTDVLFSLENFLLAAMFAALMSGTSADAVMAMVGDVKHEVLKFLQIESILNTPLVVIIPFVLLDFMQSVESVSSFLIISKFTAQIIPFLQQIVTGVGAGVIIAIIVLRILKEQYSHVLAPLALIAASLLTYVLAENLGGSGVLAVTAMGFLFGNVVLRQKGHIQEFSSQFTVFLELLVFVLVGLLIDVTFTSEFVIKSVFLFCVYLFVRFISVDIAFQAEDYTLKEKLFMTLVVPKGVATAVVAISLLGTGVVGMNIVLDLTLVFMLYSIVLASVVVKYSKYFIKMDVLKVPRKKKE